MELTHYCIFCL